MNHIISRAGGDTYLSYFLYNTSPARRFHWIFAYRCQKINMECFLKCSCRWPVYLFRLRMVGRGYGVCGLKRACAGFRCWPRSSNFRCKRVFAAKRVIAKVGLGVPGGSPRIPETVDNLFAPIWKRAFKTPGSQNHPILYF